MSETIEDLKQIEALLESFYTPSEIDTWWSAPQPMFEGRTALEMVDDGDADKLLTALKQMDEAVYI